MHEPRDRRRPGDPLMCLAAIGRVHEVRSAEGVLVADVEFEDKMMTVGADFVPDARPGLYVVVHAGMAVRLLNPEEAADALALRAEISAADPSG